MADKDKKLQTEDKEFEELTPELTPEKKSEDATEKKPKQDKKVTPKSSSNDVAPSADAVLTEVTADPSAKAIVDPTTTNVGTVPANTGAPSTNKVGSMRDGGSYNAEAVSKGLQTAAKDSVLIDFLYKKGRQLGAVHTFSDELSAPIDASYQVGRLIDLTEHHYKSNQKPGKADANLFKKVDDYAGVLEIRDIMYISGNMHTTARAEVGHSEVRTGYVKGAADLTFIQTISPAIKEISEREFGKPYNEPDGKYHNDEENSQI